METPKEIPKTTNNLENNQDNPEDQKESWVKRAGQGFWKNKKIIGKTISGVVGSYFGLKFFYDLPAYAFQKSQKTLVEEEQEGLNETFKILTSEVVDRKQKKNQEKNIKEETEEEIKDKTRKKEIMNRLMEIKNQKVENSSNTDQQSLGNEKIELKKELREIMMKDDGYKKLINAVKNFKQTIDQIGSVKEENKQMLKKELALVMSGHRDKEREINDESKQEVTEILSDYVETKIKGMQVVKEGLNTACTFTGNYALRGLVYGGCALIERGQRINQQDKRETGLTEKKVKLKAEREKTEIGQKKLCEKEKAEIKKLAYEKYKERGGGITSTPEQEKNDWDEGEKEYKANKEKAEEKKELKQKSFARKLIIDGVEETYFNVFGKDIKFKNRLKAYATLARFGAIGLTGLGEVATEGGGAFTKAFNVNRYLDRFEEIKEAEGWFNTIRSVANFNETIDKTVQGFESLKKFGSKVGGGIWKYTGARLEGTDFGGEIIKTEDIPQGAIIQEEKGLDWNKNPETVDDYVKDELGRHLLNTEKTAPISEIIKAENMPQGAIIHKGEGIEHSLIRQLKADPDFKGDAGAEAHRIAIKAGYVDFKTGQEIRVGTSGIDKVAYVLNKDEDGNVLGVTEYEKDAGENFQPRESHLSAGNFKNEFEGNTKETYEYLHPKSEPEMSALKEEVVAKSRVFSGGEKSEVIKTMPAVEPTVREEGGSKPVLDGLKTEAEIGADTVTTTEAGGKAVWEDYNNWQQQISGKTITEKLEGGGEIVYYDKNGDGNPDILEAFNKDGKVVDFVSYGYGQRDINQLKIQIDIFKERVISKEHIKFDNPDKYLEELKTIENNARIFIDSREIKLIGLSEKGITQDIIRQANIDPWAKDFDTDPVGINKLNFLKFCAQETQGFRVNDGVETINLIEKSHANIFYEDGLKYLDQLRDFQNDPGKIEGYIALAENKGSAEDALSKLFHVSVTDENYKFEHGEYIITGVEENFDIHVKVGIDNKILFGIKRTDSVLGGNWGGKGKSLLFRTDANLTNDNITRANDFMGIKEQTPSELLTKKEEAGVKIEKSASEKFLVSEMTNKKLEQINFFKAETVEIKKLLGEYYDKYGTRPEYNEFKSKVMDAIDHNEKVVQGIESGTGKVVLYPTGGYTSPENFAKGMVEKIGAETKLTTLRERMRSKFGEFKLEEK